MDLIDSISSANTPQSLGIYGWIRGGHDSFK